MYLPDCDDFEEDLVLGYKENMDLVTRLVEEGPEYIDRFIDEQARTDGAVARYIRSLRERLKRQAASILEKRREGARQRLEVLEKRRERRLSEVNEEILTLSKEQKALSDLLDEILAGELLSDHLVKMVIDAPLDLTGEKEGLGRRIIAKIVGFFVFLGSAVKRFFVWLGRKLRLIKPEKEKELSEHRARLLISFPFISGDLTDLDSKFGNALFTSPNLQAKMEKDMLKGRMFRKSRLKFRKRYLKRRYVEDAQRKFYDSIESKMQRKAKEVGDQRKHLDSKAKELTVKKKRTKDESRKEKEQLEREEKRHEEEIARKIESIPKEKVKKKITEKLKTAGYVSGENGGMEITATLIDRFADIVLTAEIQNLPTAYHAIYGASEVEGIYERGRLRMQDEISRMDIVESLVNARTRHPYDRHIYEDDIVTYWDIRGANNHVVLMFDKSGSMDENQRIVAAKKAVLALYKAILERNPRNVVDLVAFDSEVHVMDLLGVWRSVPSGFTNTGEALKTARELLSTSSADRKLIYLITDGLPEAYSDNGKVIAGDAKASLDYAVAQAKLLNQMSNVHLTLILLEPENRMYVDAAQSVISACSGRAVVVRPKELAAEMIMDFIS